MTLRIAIWTVNSFLLFCNREIPVGDGCQQEEVLVVSFWAEHEFFLLVKLFGSV